ncbi:MAG TPA: hypothetical protein DEF51_12910 [Myxococcales bacterium]|nr:hypothetical protein [Myxococcales bacterium]
MVQPELRRGGVTIALVDTSVFCELLPVPGMDSDRARLSAALKEKIEEREHLLLPMATILETGNHIGQHGDGQKRRETAKLFVDWVNKAVEGTSPFAATSFVNANELKSWLDEFPDWANRGSGLGDLSIVKEWERQCALHPQRRVYVWSKDAHLQALDRG